MKDIMTEQVFDTDLETVGAYIKILFKMHLNSQERGVLRGDHAYLRNQVGAELDQWSRIWQGLVMSNCFDISIEQVPLGAGSLVSHSSNEVVTLMSRRMIREENKRKKDATRQYKHRQGKAEKECHADVTPKSPDVADDVTQMSGGRRKNKAEKSESRTSSEPDIENQDCNLTHSGGEENQSVPSDITASQEARGKLLRAEDWARIIHTRLPLKKDFKPVLKDRLVQTGILAGHLVDTAPDLMTGQDQLQKMLDLLQRSYESRSAKNPFAIFISEANKRWPGWRQR